MKKWQGGGVSVAMVGSLADVKGNPTMATAKQIAWRKKFAAMAKAGTLTKKRRTRKANPLTRVRVHSPSMATKEAPSKRLIKRRKKTARAPAGYYANPKRSRGYRVEVGGAGGRYRCVATFGNAAEAKSYAYALHAAHPSRSVRVMK